MEMTPAAKVVNSKLNALIENNSDRLGYLWSRWQDEKEYEDFGTYADEMKKLIPEGFKFVKATKSPFGFQVQPDDFKIIVQVRVTSREIGWKAVKRV